MGPGLGMAQRADGQDGGEERRGHESATDLLAQDGHLDHPHAEPALVLGEFQGQPALLGHARPHGVVEPAGGIAAPRCVGIRTGAGQGAHNDALTDPGPPGVMVGVAVQEVGGGITQCFLIAGKVEVHGGEVYGVH